MSDETIDLETGGQPTGSQVRLRVISGPHEGTSWTLETDAVVLIGRQSPAHLRLPNEKALSREHLRLEIRTPIAILTDQGSRNGTWVNGIRMSEATISNGDVITVGDTEIVLEVQTTIESKVPPAGAADDGKQSGREKESEAGSDDSILSTRISRAPEIDRSVDEPGMADRLPVTEQPSDSEATGFEPIKPKSVGPFDLIREIGKGGMATVYYAQHRRTKEPVAIKLIRSDVPTTSKQIQMFTREASVITRLQHPRIVRAFEFGIEKSTPFLVMEYIDTIDLLDLLEKQTPEARVRIATWTISRVLQAVHYAHKEGIVHRDIKPANILAYREGRHLQIKLADFGLAKCHQGAGFSALTDEHSIRGTVGYMAPEQLENSRDAGPSVDLFSCGGCLLRMLTGRIPNVALKPSVANDALENAKHISESLGQIIQKSLQREPGQRFQSAEEFTEAIFPFHRRE